MFISRFALGDSAVVFWNGVKSGMCVCLFWQGVFSAELYISHPHPKHIFPEFFSATGTKRHFNRWRKKKYHTSPLCYNSYCTDWLSITLLFVNRLYCLFIVSHDKCIYCLVSHKKCSGKLQLIYLHGYGSTISSSALHFTCQVGKRKQNIKWEREKRHGVLIRFLRENDLGCVARRSLL